MLTMCASSCLFAADEQGWELHQDKDGIQVCPRSVKGSPACTDWADSCVESYLVERLSDSESLVFTRNDMPFPMKDRNVVAQVKRTQDAASFEVEMNSVATAGSMDEVRGRLRLTKAVAS